MQTVGTNNCIDNVYGSAANIIVPSFGITADQAFVITNNDIDTFGDQIAVLSGYVTSNIPLASAIVLSNNIPANITSISLPAGDWDVWGNAFIKATGVCTDMACWGSSTSAMVPNASNINNTSLPGIVQMGMSIPYIRFSLGSTTTIYLSCIAVFSTGAVTACGSIFARSRPT